MILLPEPCVFAARVTERRQVPIRVHPYRKKALVRAPGAVTIAGQDQGGGDPGIQNFQFTTPNELPPNSRCGKVVFSDMHVSAGSDSQPGTPFPNDCNNGALTPQEKALAFMFFDIASCVAAPIF